jgi:hypothetical protein
VLPKAIPAKTAIITKRLIILQQSTEKKVQKGIIFNGLTHIRFVLNFGVKETKYFDGLFKVLQQLFVSEAD